MPTNYWVGYYNPFPYMGGGLFSIGVYCAKEDARKEVRRKLKERYPEVKKFELEKIYDSNPSEWD